MKTSQLDNGQLQVKTSPRGVVHFKPRNDMAEV